MGTIQVKNVPAELHGELRRRAARAGMTVRDYLLALIERDQLRPTLDEWLEEVTTADPVPLTASSADLIRRGRDERELELPRQVGSGRAGHRR